MRHPFKLESARYCVQIDGDSEIYHARNNPQAFIVCVFRVPGGPATSAVRVTLVPGCASEIHLRELAEVGPCPHSVAVVVDPPDGAGSTLPVRNGDECRAWLGDATRSTR